jgi:REP element-mobilizing transposase RayT
MPRAPRVYLEGALYYVTSKVIQGQNLFNEKEDYLMYEELLTKYKSQHGFKLFAFALLPNHIHMLVETRPETTLSDIMHNITSSYTKYYNKKYNRQGHLFRGRFRAVIIEKEPYLLKLTRYIHLNPKFLGMAADSADYPYSSYLLFTGRAQEGLYRVGLDEEVKEVFGYLKNSTYEDYLKEDCIEENKALHKELSRRVFLGSDEFGKRINERIGEASVLKVSESVQEKRPRRLAISLVSGVILVVIAGSVLLYANRAVKRSASSKIYGVVTQHKAIAETKESVPGEIASLEGMTWQVKFVAGTPFQAIDRITFYHGKMASENMNLNGYSSSNYSVTKDDNRLVWETMQTSAQGMALWHGELDGEQMKGVLSLRPKEGKPQDFSFVSIKYQKNK